jgi:hypothetical protein
MRKRLEKQLLDTTIDAYVEWREACRLEADAYRSWLNATGVEASVAFMRYTVALATEERAADVYADLVRQVGSLVAGDHAGLRDYEL